MQVQCENCRLEKNNKYCYVPGTAGIGNRLYTIASAIEYCEKTGRIINVDWSDGMFDARGTNCFLKYLHLSFDKRVDYIDRKEKDIYPPFFFEKDEPSLFSDYKLTQSGNTLPKIVSKLPKKCFVGLKIGLLHNISALGFWQLKKNTDKRFIEGLSLPYKMKERIVVYADYSPPFKEETIRKYIHFSEEFQKEMNEFVRQKQLNRDSIGIHVRATDKKSDKELDKLFGIIDKFDVGKRIFLATDNCDVESQILNKYGDRVVVYPKYLPEVSGRQGVHKWSRECSEIEVKQNIFKECLADMYILSKVKILLYQGNSSFSNISRILKRDGQVIDWTK